MRGVILEIFIVGGNGGRPWIVVEGVWWLLYAVNVFYSNVSTDIWQLFKFAA